jgi:hypothetical protein
MRGQQLIDGASFGPEAMKAIGDTFDAAWVDIAGNFGNDPPRPRHPADSAARERMREARIQGGAVPHLGARGLVQVRGTQAQERIYSVPEHRLSK